MKEYRHLGSSSASVCGPLRGMASHVATHARHVVEVILGQLLPALALDPENPPAGAAALGLVPPLLPALALDPENPPAGAAALGLVPVARLADRFRLVAPSQRSISPGVMLTTSSKSSRTCRRSSSSIAAILRSLTLALAHYEPREGGEHSTRRSPSVLHDPGAGTRPRIVVLILSKRG
jgi:hypothetical protein